MITSYYLCDWIAGESEQYNWCQSTVDKIYPDFRYEPKDLWYSNRNHRCACLLTRPFKTSEVCWTMICVAICVTTKNYVKNIEKIIRKLLHPVLPWFIARAQGCWPLEVASVALVVGRKSRPHWPTLAGTGWIKRHLWRRFEVRVIGRTQSYWGIWLKMLKGRVWTVQTRWA